MLQEDRARVIPSSTAVRSVILIPSYLELETLPMLLSELIPHLTNQTRVVVIDDSPDEIANLIRDRCRSVLGKAGEFAHFISTGVKGGRGAAVRRGMELSIRAFPGLERCVECDADGSHRATDIIRVMTSPSPVDLLVGSRYLATSEIVGWTFARRTQSRILNVVIPKVLGVPLRDITNGLRRYSRVALQAILEYPAQSSAFVYLSEQAFRVVRAGLTVEELPIRFEERRAGSSTVTRDELVRSLRDLVKTVRIRFSR
jgi:dolichol-phosphate mannosyltransferase